MLRSIRGSRGGALGAWGLEGRRLAGGARGAVDSWLVGTARGGGRLLQHKKSRRLACEREALLITVKAPLLLIFGFC